LSRIFHSQSLSHNQKEALFDIFDRLQKLGDSFRQIYSSYPLDMSDEYPNCQNNCEMGLPQFDSLENYVLYLNWQNKEKTTYFPGFGYASPHAMNNMTFDIIYTIHYLNDITRDIEENGQISSINLYFCCDATRIKPELNQHSHLDIFNQKVKVLNDLGLISDQAHLNYQNQLTSEAFLSWLDYWSKQGERCNYSY